MIENKLWNLQNSERERQSVWFVNIDVYSLLMSMVLHTSMLGKAQKNPSVPGFVAGKDGALILDFTPPPQMRVALSCIKK